MKELAGTVHGHDEHVGQPPADPSGAVPSAGPAIAGAPRAARRPPPVAPGTGRTLREVAWILVLTVVTWRRELITPGLTLDESYATGLEWMGSTGQVAGRDLVFNYGPWGWVNFPRTVDPGHAVIAATAQLVVLLAVSALVVRSLDRKGYRFLYAAPVAVVALGVANLLSPADTAVIALFAGGVVLLGGTASRDERWVLGYAATVGFVATALVFIKFDAGIRAGAATLLAAAFSAQGAAGADRTRRMARAAAALGASALLVFLLVWVPEGLSNVVPFLRGSADLVTGFPAALGVESNPAWEYLAAAVVVAGLAGSTWWQLRTEERIVRVLGSIAVAALVWLLFKSGFTRHDGHSMTFFASMTVLAVVLLPAAVRLPWRLAGCVLTVATALVATQAIGASPAPVFLDAPRGARAFTTFLGLIPSSGWADSNDGAARRILAAVPDDVLAAADGKSVHIEPILTSIAWALAHEGHGTTWSPIPTMQSYNGYTPYLDDRNAADLASSSAPEVVIRTEDFGNLGIQWESPAYKQQLFCWYEPTVTDKGWQALARRTASICGPPSSPMTVRSRRDADGAHLLDIPAVADDEMLVARFSGGPIGSTPAVLALPAKPSTDDVTADPDRPGATAYPFDDTTAGQPHVVSYPACWRRTGTVDPAAPSRLRFAGGYAPADQDDVTATFERVPTQCPSP